MKLKKLFINLGAENYLILAGFILSLSFFILQHFLNTGWDFMVYSLNSEYFSGHGSFFEWTRPPLAPFLLSILSFVSFGSLRAAEYLFLALISGIYLFASIKIADRFKVNRALFYIASLCPFLLIYGLFEGTELLSLSLVMLSLAYLGDKKAPLFLALASLARYPNMIFLLLLLFRKDWKKIPRDLAIFFACLIPWLAFSYFKTGSFLAGYMDSYSLIVAFRSYISSSAKISDFFILGHLALLAIIGLYFLIKDKNKKSFIFPIYIMLFVLIAGLIEYCSAKIKVERYLFLLILPLSYLSSIALSKIKKRKLLALTCILLLAFSLSFSFYDAFNSRNKFIQADSYADYIEDNQGYIGNCSISSNAHIFLNYAGIPSEGAPDSRMLQKSIREGYRVVLFKSISEPSYTFNSSFIESMNLIHQDEKAVILGDLDKCSTSIYLDKTYLKKIDELYMEIYGISFEATFYELFFKHKQA